MHSSGYIAMHENSKKYFEFCFDMFFEMRVSASQKSSSAYIVCYLKTLFEKAKTKMAQSHRTQFCLKYNAEKMLMGF